MRLLQIVKFMLEQAWTILKINFPGTDVPIVALLFMPMVVSLVVAFFRNMFGIGQFADLTHLPFKAVGGINRLKARGYNRVTSHADNVSRTLSGK